MRDQLPEHKASELFYLLSEMNEIPLYTWHADGNVISANKACYDLVGHNHLHHEKEGITLKRLTPEEDHLQMEQNVKKMIETKEPLTTERKYLKRDGTIIQVKQYSFFSPEDNIGFTAIYP